MRAPDVLEAPTVRSGFGRFILSRRYVSGSASVRRFSGEPGGWRPGDLGRNNNGTNPYGWEWCVRFARSNSYFDTVVRLPVGIPEPVLGVDQDRLQPLPVQVVPDDSAV